jgi:hypothetical protein
MERIEQREKSLGGRGRRDRKIALRNLRIRHPWCKETIMSKQKESDRDAPLSKAVYPCQCPIEENDNQGVRGVELLRGTNNTTQSAATVAEARSTTSTAVLPRCHAPIPDHGPRVTSTM